MDPKASLKRYLAEHGIRPAAFARAIQYDKGNFHRILNGAAWPPLELALAIQKETNGAVPMQSWAEAKAA